MACCLTVFTEPQLTRLYKLLNKNRIQVYLFNDPWWFYCFFYYFFYIINTVLVTVTSSLLFKSNLQLIYKIWPWFWVWKMLLEGELWWLWKWKVPECIFCPKKAALDMECHRQLFLPHQRTCYKDSPTWVEIMPPIPAPKHTLSCSIVQRGRNGSAGGRVL